MSKNLLALLGVVSLLAANSKWAQAESALTALGGDFNFLNSETVMPRRLSDFKGLEINSFTTNDGVRIRYWEAGQGEPLLFIPGWGSSGADYINIMYLLRERYHVYVMDPRNQGLSDKTKTGLRVSRLAKDFEEWLAHLKVDKVFVCGWSMGASVLWSYVDLFGETKIKKLILIDQPASIYAHSNWSKKERSEAGAFTTSVENMVEFFTGAASPKNKQGVNTSLINQREKIDSAYFKNSIAFSEHFIKWDDEANKSMLFDHATKDWRDVIREKIHVPTAIFTGESSDFLASQRWIQSVIKDSKIFVYKKKEFGDHFLHLKNPEKFTRDLAAFLATGSRGAN